MDIGDVIARLEQSRANILDLLRRYQVDEAVKDGWAFDPRLHRAFASKLISSGHPTRAFELVRAGLGLHPDDQELKYLGALALRRGGNLHRAADYVEKLLGSLDLQPEIRLLAMSLRAALLKVEYTRKAQAQPDLARASAGLYERAYRLARDEALFPSPGRAIFPGVNAATMAFMADDLPKARELAGEVNALARAALDRPGDSGDLWLMATVAETSLLLGDLGEAGRWYGRAIARAEEGGRDGDVEAIRGNFQLLRARIPLSEEIWGFFNVGNVVAFAGHMIDQPARRLAGGDPPRFPDHPALVERVAGEIGRQVELLNARVGYCSVACGADILFAERMIERKAELHVVLPFDLDDFYRTSVDYGDPEGGPMRAWRGRCDRVLAEATQVHHATTEKYLGDDILFEHANTFILGLAVLRARERGVKPFALAVAERDPDGRRPSGGTADFLARGAESGLEHRVVDLAALRADLVLPAGPPAPAIEGAPAAGGRVRRKMMVMLFADVKNFSKLDDDRYPAFFSTFLDEVKQIVDATSPPPAFINTWGDGLYVAFEGVVQGADFALRLVDRVREVDWGRHGLPEDTTVRVGIHAGPVYQRMDPIIGRENVFGSQVNRAARIEPVTTPGSVFASEQFAAALSIAEDHPFFCEYVGIEELAKGFDRCPLYLLARR